MIFDYLIFFFYRFLLFPAALLLLHLTTSLWPKKIQEMIKERKGTRYVPLMSRPIWIHASSGEIEYAKSVIRSIKEYFPQIPVLVTYFSPSAKKLIEKFEGVELAIALPWDRRKDMAKFVAHYNPRALLIARTDVWPEMAYQTRLRNIPSLLFAATLSEKSSRKSFASRSLSRFAFHQLTAIHCVTATDELNFFNLKVRTPIEIVGDTRFDQVLYRLNHPAPVRNELKPSTRKNIFVAGSTWPQDEEVILPTLPEFIARGGRVILAPHEISDEHLQHIETRLRALGLSFVRYSTANTWREDNVLLVDKIGCLQELYTWGQVGFVGGSFKDKVHSVMEPLCAGLPVILGPHHENNREALQFSRIHLTPELFMVTSVHNQNEFQQALFQLSSQDFSQGILAKTQEQSGATNKVMDWLQRDVF